MVKQSRTTRVIVKRVMKSDSSAGWNQKKMVQKLLKKSIRFAE